NMILHRLGVRGEGRREIEIHAHSPGADHSRGAGHTKVAAKTRTDPCRRRVDMCALRRELENLREGNRLERPAQVETADQASEMERILDAALRLPSLLELPGDARAALDRSIG